MCRRYSAGEYGDAMRESAKKAAAKEQPKPEKKEKKEPKQKLKKEKEDSKKAAKDKPKPKEKTRKEEGTAEFLPARKFAGAKKGNRPAHLFTVFMWWLCVCMRGLAVGFCLCDGLFSNKAGREMRKQLRLILR